MDRRWSKRVDEGEVEVEGEEERIGKVGGGRKE